MIVTVPPVYSAKRAIRYSYARTIGTAGSILCDVLSHANDHHYHLKENDTIRHNLITWRSKLNKVKLRNFGGMTSNSDATAVGREAYQCDTRIFIERSMARGKV